MSENPTETRKLEELGTTLYDRGREVEETMGLLDKSVCCVPRELWGNVGNTAYHHSFALRSRLKRLGLRLNPNAAADSRERNGEPLELVKTERGLTQGGFRDFHGVDCLLSKSPTTRDDAIWLGTAHDPMHLTRPMVAALLPHLRRFVETGEL